MIENKAQWASDVCYEIGMLHWARLELRAPDKADALRNALIECFLTHYRNVMEFLFRDKRAPHAPTDADDVYWNSFLAGCWDEQADEWPADFKRISKFLSHISKSRQPGFQWPFEAMAQRFVKRFRAFLEKLDPPTRELFTCDPALEMRPSVDLTARLHLYAATNTMAESTIES